MSAWQPIETAPRDGSFILVAALLPTGNVWRVVAMRWRNITKRRHGQWFRTQRWVGGGLHVSDEQFKGWMPLPEPPRQANDKAFR